MHNLWILDLASLKECFDSFQELDNSCLTLPNGDNWAFKCVWTVKFQMLHGVKSNLGDIAYAPDLRCYLISLIRFSCAATAPLQEAWWKSWGSAWFYLEEKKKNGLYCLVGSANGTQISLLVILSLTLIFMTASYTPIFKFIFNSPPKVLQKPPDYHKRSLHSVTKSLNGSVFKLS